MASAPLLFRRAPTASEHRTDRTFAIVDYKTGQPPTGKQVRMGLSPQLTLEAAILREGGFDGIAAGSSVSEIVYVKLNGNTPPVKSGCSNSSSTAPMSRNRRTTPPSRRGKNSKP